MQQEVRILLLFKGELKSEGEVPFCTSLSFSKDYCFSQYSFNNKYLIWFKVRLVCTQTFKLAREQL